MPEQTEDIKLESNLIELPEWQALKEHLPIWRHAHLRDLFAQNPKRFHRFSYTFNNILFDFSKNYLTDTTLNLLIDLAQACNLKGKITALFNGDCCNQSEQKPALHMALRHPEPTQLSLLASGILPELENMRHFVNQVRNGAFRGYNNDCITDVVHIGIGGSLLGPKMIARALATNNKSLNIHFVSSLDGKQATELLPQLNPAQTLCIIASKTFTTQETLNNARIFQNWFSCSSPDAVRKHFIGISANIKAMTEFGILKEHQFHIWDYIGGRYSLWSAMSLAFALSAGMEAFEKLLSGAYAMDKHFQHTPFITNIPVIMGLLTVWYRNFIGCGSHVILPYDTHLELIPAYLQQLEMESCGKRVTQRDTSVHCKTGSAVWGEIGSDGEHAFFQWLHQGTDIIPADFIVPIHSNNHRQDLVLSHALAQAQALMTGALDTDNPLYKHYPGNKPSTMILLESLTPETLGALIACYEHKVFVQSAIWDINPFDQWGVELGKYLSGQILALLSKQQTTTYSLDASTSGLLAFIKRLSKNTIITEDSYG